MLAMVDLKELGGRLRALRFALGYSTREVARNTGIPNTTIARWERAGGRTFPDTDKLARLCSFYGVSLEELLDPDTPSRVWFTGSMQASEA
jgi:transcriptional regulator with XRE-family HTH domain